MTTEEYRKACVRNGVKSSCLEIVANACATIADQVNDGAKPVEHEFKVVTHRGQGGFRFTAERYIDGVLCEITVKTLPEKKPA